MKTHFGEFGAISSIANAKVRQPATPPAEGSGLFDIRAMRALIGERSGAAADRSDASDDERLPSFAGDLAGISAAPLVSPEPALVASVPAASTVRPSSGRGLQAIAGVLALALLGLGALVVVDATRASEPSVVTIVEPTLAAEPSASERGDEPEPSPEPAASVATEAEAEPEAEAEAEPEPAAEPRKPVKPRARARARSNPAKTDAREPELNASAPSKPAPASTPDDIDIDCLIDVEKCKPRSKPSEPSKPSRPDPELPAKLGQAQILAGINPIKAAAKACGAGTTVEIKFSVRGATGRVASARPLREHEASAVGRCVAKAAADASFAKFGAEQQGFSFKFRL